MIIKLKHDDERIGKPGNRPKLDVLGNEHRGDILNRYRFLDGRYVIIPMGIREPIQVELESGVAPHPMNRPPNQPPKEKGTDGISD